MQDANFFWGPAPIITQPDQPGGSWVEREDGNWFRISDYSSMRPFLVSVLSGFDHWMYISSSGALSCGRKSPDSALFPYETDDRLHVAGHVTGPVSLFWVQHNGKRLLWKPFGGWPHVYPLERNLYKNAYGNRLEFEEINHDLNLRFSYQWAMSARYGFVRSARLENLGKAGVRVHLVDGLRNLLPAGITRELQSTMSTLMDAYKQSECVPDLAAAIYSLGSIPSDGTSPCEALRATLCSCVGLTSPEVLLNDGQLTAFEKGLGVYPDQQQRGQRSNFLIADEINLEPAETRGWAILADVDLDHMAITERLQQERQGLSIQSIEQEVLAGEQRLIRLAEATDGLQVSNDIPVCIRHYSNSIFNIMRGGVFLDGYQFPSKDFREFVAVWNRPLSLRLDDLIESVEGEDGYFPQNLTELIAVADSSGDFDFQRIALEYLPLGFGRRHGDPSRPWNNFNIDVTRPDGSDRLYYEGNWRDVFQNWEALAHSYPHYLPGMIARFVNASTPDGYNPYHVGRNGFDWEVPEEGRAWSNIGYWGDHQISYLCRLLELALSHNPQGFCHLLEKEIFVYANVPYRIKSFEDILRDPRNTIRYDQVLAEEIGRRVGQLGSDGKLCHLGDKPYRVNLLEKLLLPVLIKLSNLVPGGGIWMNTQRPEWNDANNALAGFGLSIVTLGYLRRYLVFMVDLLNGSETRSFLVSKELVDLATDVREAIAGFEACADGNDPGSRWQFLESAGRAACRYRSAVYEGHKGVKQHIEAKDLVRLLDSAKRMVDDSLRCNRRSDGLYHSYNLLHLGKGQCSHETLDEMLEGQVAILSSGYLAASESLEVLQALRSSKLYCRKQNSYLLYPDRKNDSFLQKNIIPEEFVAATPWLRDELSSGRCRFVYRDASGLVRFRSDYRNATDLRRAMLAGTDAPGEAVDQACEVYEAVFRHHRFTGRSSSMYKYEGLGCIYWHMVSKLLVAIQEVIHRAQDDPASSEVIAALRQCYLATRDGLGMHKSPAEYGAFPADAYSHTPSFAGVQQPGMTGQVKEDIVRRFEELGVAVAGACVSFRPELLSQDEFLTENKEWSSLWPGCSVTGYVPTGGLGFLFCGCVVIYRLAAEQKINLFLNDGTSVCLQGNSLDRLWSSELLGRTGRILRLEVFFDASIPK